VGRSLRGTLYETIAHATVNKSTREMNPDYRVAYDPDPTDLRNAIGDQLPEDGETSEAIMERLTRAAAPGLVDTTGPRYFGFVVGGALPAAVAADQWTTAHDQVAGFYVLSPASAVIEDITSDWALDLLDLPRAAAVGFVTGGQMANVMGLAAGRHRVFAQAGWDVATRGLAGAPKLRILIGAEAHGTIDRALALLGLGSATSIRVPADAQGRMRADELERLLCETSMPTLVCAQAGNVNTGAFDPLRAIGELCQQHGAWLHIDGAFGLWARACKEKRALADGAELADSLSTDAHKWLNAPYDCGLIIVKEEAHLMAATSYEGAYLVKSADARRREPCRYTPESSRRARATPVYAALRQLGRSGLDDLVARCCSHARLFAKLLQESGAAIANEVVLNQVLVAWAPPTGIESEAFVDAVITRIQRDGTCWLGATTWHGQRLMRISVSNWQTSEGDVRDSVAAIVRCVEAERATPTEAGWSK
jgi:glutamate/tyrosine decarboxylase-like PLP-dependent enzyme